MKKTLELDDLHFTQVLIALVLKSSTIPQVLHIPLFTSHWSYFLQIVWHFNEQSINLPIKNPYIRYNYECLRNLAIESLEPCCRQISYRDSFLTPGLWSGNRDIQNHLPPFGLRFKSCPVSNQTPFTRAFFLAKLVCNESLIIHFLCCLLHTSQLNFLFFCCKILLFFYWFCSTILLLFWLLSFVIIALSQPWHHLGDDDSN